MGRVAIAWAALLLVLSGLWFAAASPLPPVPDLFVLRTLLIPYTGVLAIGVMSIGMLLAIRPAGLERWMGGLDKMYRLHKWLGITALVLATTHWIWTQAAKWVVGLGWLVRPPRVRAPEPDSPVLRLFNTLRESAEGVGEWALYAAVVLIALALIKRFPYHLFFKTHRLIALAYLAMAFHAVILLPYAYWPQPLGLVMVMLLTAGSYAAVIVLLRRVGQSRRVIGVVETLTHHRSAGVLEVGISFAGRWPGHKAGQFAFATFDTGEGAHPFTISSAWKDDGHALLLIKNLGDYTAHLPHSLKLGDAATLEGPYGTFDFEVGRSRQIWVAGGIGITPFIARMNQLARIAGAKPVDLFYSSAKLDPDAARELARLAREAGIVLHILQDIRGERLEAAQVCRVVPEWKSADTWFCGPAAFGRQLRMDLLLRGMRRSSFHQELFAMR